MFVLSVNIDEKRAELFEGSQRDGAVIQERARAAVGRAFAADENVFGLFKPMVVPPAAERGMARRVESPVDLALVGTLAHLVGLKPLAQQQADRVQEYRFPRAGFTGQDVEAFVPFETKIIDQDKVSDTEFTQHKKELRIAPL